MIFFTRSCDKGHERGRVHSLGSPFVRSPLSINYGYHAARKLAALRKAQFAAREKLGALRPRLLGVPIEGLRLVSMAGEKSFLEMLRCVWVFGLHFRRPPARWRIISDGTLTAAHADALIKLLPTTEVLDIEALPVGDVPHTVRARAADSWLYRKLLVLAASGRETGELFLDSDVIFFAGATSLEPKLNQLGDRPAYMRDCAFNHDLRLLNTDSLQQPPVNSGLLWLTPRLDWSPAFRAIESTGIDSCPAWTDQTAAHLAMHASSAAMFDPAKFVLSAQDQFSWRDDFASDPCVVCRHYVSPIRHKMWLYPNARH